MSVDPLLTLALVLTAGLAGGEVATRVKLPRVTGWILTGIILRALDLPGLNVENLAGFQPFTNFILGYIAFTVGSHLHLYSLKNAGRRLLLIILTEALITPVIVVLALTQIGGVPDRLALVLAAVAVAGAPGTTMLVIREARAKGVFVKTLVASVALIDMVAVSLYVVIDSELHQGLKLDGLGFVLAGLPQVGRVLGLAIAVGLGCAVVVIVLTRTIVGAQLLGASLVAAILLAWGTASLLDVSSILACTFVGIALANLMPDKEKAGEAYLDTFGSVLFTAFYTLAGLRLDFSQVVPMAGLVLLFFAARLVGKVTSAFTAMSLARGTDSVKRWLGLALLPHGGVAVGLLFIAAAHEGLADLADPLLAIGLAALAINQLVGPSATRVALTRAGEANKDRSRLLDFLREQDISVSLKGTTKDEVVDELVDVLFKTHDVEVDKQTFLDQLREREADSSTCLGEGLMVPHARVATGDGVAGVLGISREGFHWETPDGRPIHAILILATPPEQKDLHIEVLAAFAMAMSADGVREQLFHARSAAHAYDVLHGTDVADSFNYFLDDHLEEAS